MIRLRKYFARIAPLYQFAHIEKRGLIRDPHDLCRMLCVITMTIVYFSFNVKISSSIFRVDTGSRADVGSSIRRTSGFVASALAMHSRR